MPGIRKITGLAAAFVSLTLSMTVGQADAADITLRFAHFWGGNTVFHKELYAPWKDSVEKASDGRIKVELYPAQTLSKAPASYEAVKNRIADATGTIQGYSPGRFPLSQIVELPGLTKSGANASCVLQKMYDNGDIASEYEDTHVLYLFGHGSGEIHTKDKLVKTPADLEGLRIRRPTTLVGQMLEDMGAQPVGIPVTEAYQALQRDIVDGNVNPYDAMLSFRLNELISTHTETKGLYTIAFVVTMNKNIYDGLPDDLKKILDDHSGMDWALKAGRLFDMNDKKGRKEAEELGHSFHVIEGGVAANPDWKPFIDKAIDSYLGELEDKGLDARKIWAAAQGYASECPAE